MPISRKSVFFLAIFLMLAGIAWAGITGSISGIVTDASASVIPNAAVTVTNVGTGATSTIQTDGKGFYSFPDLAVGIYNLQVEVKGFKIYEKKGIVIDANSAIRVDVRLEIGTVAEKVTVSTDAVQVETQSTQMGEVITGQKMTAVPLNGRDFTNLLALQPGVVPNAYAAQASEMGNREVGGGDTNSGNQSINGQREAANGFMINGANVEEGKNNGTAAIPNLDSIDEFRIITNNFDSEYGNYSGGQVNVVTKSGSNSFHGDAFEFLRNSVFDARNYFDQTGSVGKFNQNQFGGTFGGPIKKDKIFFFTDYQGTRRIRGATTSVQVPSSDDLQGMLADGYAGQIGGAVRSDCSTTPNTCWSKVLAQRLGGQPVENGEPYYQAGCNSTNWTAGSTTACVFPTQTIPSSAWSPAAAGILANNYIPSPNLINPFGNNTDFFVTNALDQRLRDDKVGMRVDFNTRFGNISTYYHGDDATRSDPGAVPGFNDINRTRDQVAVISDTKSFGSTSVNEARFSFLRSAQALAYPSGGIGVTLSSLGFTEGFSQPGGIGPINPQLEGVPTINFNSLGFSIGVPADTTRQFDNTFQWQDNFTKIIGRHSLKFGGQFHYDQINDRNFYGEDGNFTFDGSETGSDFADFLLGVPANFTQASMQILDTRSKYMGLFAQDSWRVTPDLTLNYGLRWEFSNPWYDTGNKIETIIPGVQSVVFPGAPLGYLVPGDPSTPGGAPGAVPRTLAPTQYHNFAPRLGLAYSPSADSGFIAKLTGGPGKSSIRLGFGIYYTSIEDLSQFQEIGDAPYGDFLSDGNSPGFAAPYQVLASGTIVPSPFPLTFPPPGVSAKNPDTTFPWSLVEPIGGALAYNIHNVAPYSEDYELSLQRQFGTKTVLSLSFVGNEAHKLISEIEANPGNETLCAQLNQLGASPACNLNTPGGAEYATYTLPFGTAYPTAATNLVEGTGSCVSTAQTCNTINTLYTVLGPNFTDNPYESTIAQSSYNSFQASIRHNSELSSFLFGYTFSHCRDDASGLEEGVNPFNIRLSLGMCAFDVTHNFVASYDQQLPFNRIFHASSWWGTRLTEGWAVSGITTFATGLPVNMSESDDNSLTGTINTEAPIDLPDFTAGRILSNTNPRQGQAYFNVNLFSAEPSGQIGNSPRRFFHGPGLNNWDFALLKDTKITESKTIQFRFEGFNIFNHAQFNNPNGNFDSGNFGFVNSANDPRIMQAALKFLF